MKHCLIETQGRKTAWNSFLPLLDGNFSLLQTIFDRNPDSLGCKKRRIQSPVDKCMKYVYRVTSSSNKREREESCVQKEGKHNMWFIPHPLSAIHRSSMIESSTRRDSERETSLPVWIQILSFFSFQLDSSGYNFCHFFCYWNKV